MNRVIRAFRVTGVPTLRREYRSPLSVAVECPGLSRQVGATCGILLASDDRWWTHRSRSQDVALVLNGWGFERTMSYAIVSGILIVALAVGVGVGLYRVRMRAAERRRDGQSTPTLSTRHIVVRMVLGVVIGAALFALVTWL